MPNLKKNLRAVRGKHGFIHLTWNDLCAYRYGHVPNGGRIYYINRSQPPMLTPMVAQYYDTTGDRQIISDNIHLLEREYNFWTNERTVTVVAPETGVKHDLTRYAVNLGHPRPEGYLEDMHITEGLSQGELVVSHWLLSDSHCNISCIYHNT